MPSRVAVTAAEAIAVEVAAPIQPGEAQTNAFLPAIPVGLKIFVALQVASITSVGMALVRLARPMVRPARVVMQQAIVVTGYAGTEFAVLVSGNYAPHRAIAATMHHVKAPVAFHREIQQGILRPIVAAARPTTCTAAKELSSTSAGLRAIERGHLRLNGRKHAKLG